MGSGPFRAILAGSGAVSGVAARCRGVTGRAGSVTGRGRFATGGAGVSELADWIGGLTLAGRGGRRQATGAGK